MNKPYIILVGAGGHARSCIDVIELQGQFRIAGLVGCPDEVGERHLGYEVIGSDNDLCDMIYQYQYALVTVGQIRTPDVRIRLYRYLKQTGFELPVIVSPRAYVSSHAKIGEGTIVMHDALINAGVNIGVNCIINTKVLLEHDVIIEDNCHIATCAAVNGEAVVRHGCFVGSNTVLTQLCEVAANSFVKASSIYTGHKGL